MNRDQAISLLAGARWYDPTQLLSIFTPPIPGERIVEADCRSSTSSDLAW